ncbi:hypothetical protein [Arthrobacter sp. FW306-07-I]|uniref:hypothetical protein n=1 Tax=Arthrobacter sp. FW306-07-I TaxID=2879622 RepID=UPI001F2C1767|nr:hypothetical protein [Arthrobacter sp. FW306-07-I]UKA77322.1 hypothetical protein LFT46_10035 [Arthrobacter sp. FW306-07-I]
MQQQDLNPAPRGWLEKANDSSIGMFLFIPLFLGVFFSLKDAIGDWAAAAIAVLASLALQTVLALLIAPATRKRVALDAEQGIFECAHRERASSLKRRWAMGYAKAEPGRILFQARTGMTGPVFGPVEIYSEPRAVSEPLKAPWTVFPRGRLIELSTDKGNIELAASPSSLNLLFQSSLNDG